MGTIESVIYRLPCRFGLALLHPFNSVSKMLASLCPFNHSRRSHHSHLVQKRLRS